MSVKLKTVALTWEQTLISPANLFQTQSIWPTWMHNFNLKLESFQTESKQTSIIRETDAEVQEELPVWKVTPFLFYFER